MSEPEDLLDQLIADPIKYFANATEEARRVIRAERDKFERLGIKIPSRNSRPGWDDYYLTIASAVSRRGECSRRQVGAIIVRDHTIVSTGFNGAPPGEPSCLDGACPRANSKAVPGQDYAQTGCTAIHAEVNAIIRAGRERATGATIYVTEEPCVLCLPLIKAAGITKIVT